MSTYLDSLVQLCCGEGGTLQTGTTGMCGECAQWVGHAGFATTQGGEHFPGLHCSVSRVLCKGTVPSGPRIFPHFPGLSHAGSRALHKATDLAGLCIWCPSQSQAAQMAGCLASTPSQVGQTSYSPSQFPPLGFLGAQRRHSPRFAVCLLWGADLLAFQLWLLLACLSASGEGGCYSGLLSFSIHSPLFCEYARGHETFARQVLLFCLSGDPLVCVAISH